MNQHPAPPRRFRFTLRDLFLIVTAAAVGCALGLPLAEWLRPVGAGHSPEADEFWLDWFARGDDQQRHTALGVIAHRARNSSRPDRFTIALVEAAMDDDPLVRSQAALGLRRAAATDDAARAALERLAADDPSDKVRAVARQVLADGLTNAEIDE